ncbi:neuronal acetylcholine receptor subunit alpha-9-like [Tubulanus polymorphus]|uniref:neuronal acetylcholine receptor subunit alpha-9-like n=1 Tax=Tubulanus polymorphus TaxID=672921 RepID=UPI003DA264E8
MFLGVALAGRRQSYEYLLKRRLKRGYDTSSRPVRDDSSSITVTIAMSLYHILDTNERHQTLSALLSIRLQWYDEYLTWNKSDYGNLKMIWLPANQIWVPDLVITNYASEEYLPYMNTNAIIESNGRVLWMFPLVVKIYCSLNVRYFPFDEQKCDIKFISWTYSGYEVNITRDTERENIVYYKPKNQQWRVEKISVRRNISFYACCDEPYPDIKFTIHMRRRSLFYIINLICPCLLIYLISFLGFFLPVESGEKVNLEITVLLALVVFLLMVGETMPPTPDTIPVVGMLVGTTMVMVSLALVMAVIVTNIYFKKDTNHRVPVWIRTIVLDCCGCCCKRKTSRSPRFPSIEKIGGRSFMIDGDIDLTDLGASPHAEGDTFIYHCDTAFRNGHLPYCAHEGNRNHPEEWQRLAYILDRTFFWLFTVLSVVTFVFIIWTIRPVFKKSHM